MTYMYMNVIPCSYRTLGDGYCEMTSTLNIDAEILKWSYSSSLHYKYTVFSPKVEKDHDCYEYLHDYSGIANRCLRIPTSSQYWQLVDHRGSLL